MNPMLLQRVNDIYKDWKTGHGFFYYLNQYAVSAELEIPFLDHTDSLDLEYHGNFSGTKITSTLIDNWYDEETFSTTQAVKLAETFWKLEGERLLRMYESYTAEYNPIHNYDMTYSGTDEHSGDDSLTKAGSERSENYGTVTSEHGIQGFDSSNYQDADKTTTTYGDTSVNPLVTNTSYVGRTDTTEYNSEITRSYTKSGNIGVKTQQEMLREEFQLWEWNFYYRCLFPAVDKLITIPLY